MRKSGQTYPVKPPHQKRTPKFNYTPQLHLFYWTNGTYESIKFLENLSSLIKNVIYPNFKKCLKYRNSVWRVKYITFTYLVQDVYVAIFVNADQEFVFGCFFFIIKCDKSSIASTYMNLLDFASTQHSVFESFSLFFFN